MPDDISEIGEGVSIGCTGLKSTYFYCDSTTFENGALSDEPTIKGYYLVGTSG